MRLSSLFAIITSVIGFITILTPACYFLGYGTARNEVIALSWIDLQESPVLWIYLACTIFVAMHDIDWFQGLEFVRKSDIRFIRALLIGVAVGMAFSLELSVHVYYTQQETFWKEALLFQIPEVYNIQNFTSIGYHMIRICRLMLCVTFFLALFEKPKPRLYYKVKEKMQKDKKSTIENEEVAK